MGSFTIFMLCAAIMWSVPEVRIKEIATIGGMRDNQLVGVGLVTGLSGRGDSPNSVMLRDAIANLVSHFGFTLSPSDVRSRNCAVVMVTADIPAYIRPGDRFDIVISSLGDARSLEGGILLQTALKAANNQTYAVAQGMLSVSQERNSVKTVGVVQNGAIAEREVVATIVSNNSISIILKQADFVTAAAVAKAISEQVSGVSVLTRDASRIEILVPEAERGNIVAFIAKIQAVTVKPDASTKVVIDSRSGMVVMGENVKIGKVAVSYKSASVQVGSFYSAGEDTAKDHFVVEETISVEDFVKTMKDIGISTDAVIQMLQSIEKAGALYGTLVVK